MRNDRRMVSAFTLLELVVTMIIGSIIISLVFGLFLKIQVLWGGFHNEQEKVTELLMFETVFENDMDKADIISSENGHVYYFLSKKDTIVYYFTDRITRVFAGHRDTFSFGIKNFKPKYIRSLAPSGIVKDISFDVIKPMNLTGVTFIKEYTSADLVQITNNN